MENKEQTAVEWLINEVRNSIQGMSVIVKEDIFKQAKKMENEQLFEFFKAGQDSMEEGGKSFHQITDKYLTINRI